MLYKQLVEVRVNVSVCCQGFVGQKCYLFYSDLDRQLLKLGENWHDLTSRSKTCEKASEAVLNMEQFMFDQSQILKQG